MNETERDRLKRKLEIGLSVVIRMEELTDSQREKGDMPLMASADEDNTDIKVNRDAAKTQKFSVTFYNKCASFELLTCEPVDTAINDDNVNFYKGVIEWWPKYRCCLVDYWNLCNPDQPISHPECWGCRDN